MPRALLVLLAATCLCSANPASGETLLDANRRVEMAQIRLRLYEQVEYPTQRRQLTHELRVAEAEVASLKRLLQEYEPFDRFSTGRALVLTIESTRLSLLRAELRRDDFKRQLSDLQRFHVDRLRLLMLELEEARACL
ncbi:MAG: hypothetical protein KDA37_11980 [Planctomycetales bacterium]|nr:hypothetical protein [Planctomycetales bacterium]